MSTSLFERIVVVDWSASAVPKRGADSIWIAVIDVLEDDTCAISNPSTRAEAAEQLSGVVASGRRSLIGVDFSLGYPAGTAAAAGLDGVPWEATWSHLGAAVRDDATNSNNRFAVASNLNLAISGGTGPFWGCPPRQATASLSTTKPSRDEGWPPEWRAVESAMRLHGHRPFSSWQLLGAGAVGGQSVVGVAALDRMRSGVGSRLAVWPFTTGLVAPVGQELVVAEVWPSLWPVDVPMGVVKDAAQVEATARRIATADRAGELASWFTPAIDPTSHEQVVEEEGWVLGVGVPAACLR